MNMAFYFENSTIFWQCFIYLFCICNGAHALLQCWFLHRFTGAADKKWHYFAYLFVNYGISVLEVEMGFPVLNVILSILQSWCFLQLVLRQSFSNSVITSLVQTTVMAVAEMIMGPILSVCLFFTKDNRSVFTALNMISAAAMVLIVYFVFAFLIRHAPLKKSSYEKSLMLYFLPLLFLLGLTAIYSQINAQMEIGAHGVWSDRTVNVGLLDGQAVLLSCLSVAYIGIGGYGFHKAAGYHLMEKQKLQAEQQLSFQRQYAVEAEMRYEQTRSFRHDLKNHLTVLKGLLEKRDMEHAAAYLGQIDEISKSLCFQVRTGNRAVDVLLSDKLALAKKAGIQVQCDVTLSQVRGVEDVDLCVILGNALDNALKACLHQSEGMAWIDLKADSNRGFLLIDVMNSRDPTMDDPQGSGIGIPNMEAVALKYGGMVQTQSMPEKFILTVLLNLSSRSEN